MLHFFSQLDKNTCLTRLLSSAKKTAKYNILRLEIYAFIVSEICISCFRGIEAPIEIFVFARRRSSAMRDDPATKQPPCYEMPTVR